MPRETMRPSLWALILAFIVTGWYLSDVSELQRLQPEPPEFFIYVAVVLFFASWTIFSALGYLLKTMFTRD